jgi:hypothetical protein
MRLFLLLPLFLLIGMTSISQDCNCNIDQVENNTVEPCSIIVGTVDTVSTTTELKNAIIAANNDGGNRTILIADGSYQIASIEWYPYITASDVVFRSLSGIRDNVMLTGNGMIDVAPNVESGFYLVGDNITIADLTIKDVGNHGIATQGDNLFVHNVRIQDTFEQMIKGTSADDGADFGIVQCSLFEYTAGIGPQWYIGGLDIHKGDQWIVRDNIFRNIASPEGSTAEHAVHFWNNSANNIVERNWIINCDRGIGFGLGDSPNEGGIIRNNMIYNDGAGPFNDVGIGIQSSPNTQIYNNSIHIQYFNAIEYRFPITLGVEIANNLCNRNISSQNGAVANLTTNIDDASDEWFLDISQGDLHLVSSDIGPVDSGTDLGSLVENDLNQTPRPQGTGYDIGAHELWGPTSIELKEDYVLNIFPNPSNDLINIQLNSDPGTEIMILNVIGEVVYFGQNLANENLAINVSFWNPGVYICVLTSESSHQSARFTICH